MSCDVEKTKFYFAPQCTTIDFWEGLSRRENVTDVNGTVTEELRLWGLRFLLVVAMLMALMIILMLMNGDNNAVMIFLDALAYLKTMFKIHSAKVSKRKCFFRNIS